MKWRVYYGDGSVYASPSDPYFAPASNVQVIIQEADNERGFIQIHGYPFYAWHSHMGWCGHDEAGRMDYEMHADGPLKLLFGRTVADRVFQNCSRRAVREW